VLILDTSAFIQGFTPTQHYKSYTTQDVVHEIKERHTRIKIEGLIESRVLSIRASEELYDQYLEKVSFKMGEKQALSKADKSLLALALNLKHEKQEPIIISDDYSIQNIATKLGIESKGLSSKGIKKVIEWRIYCPGCKKKYEKTPIDRTCLICGTPLKRKPKKLR
jgi:UPF0271 protein